MKVELQYVRKGRFVHTPDGGLWEEFPSISKAKKWSWEFQRKNGGLGKGSVQVEEHRRKKVAQVDNRGKLSVVEVAA